LKVECCLGSHTVKTGLKSRPNERVHREELRVNNCYTLFASEKRTRSRSFTGPPVEPHVFMFFLPHTHCFLLPLPTPAPYPPLLSVGKGNYCPLYPPGSLASRHPPTCSPPSPFSRPYPTTWKQKKKVLADNR
jgi:hypothetical protein